MILEVTMYNEYQIEKLREISQEFKTRTRILKYHPYIEDCNNGKDFKINCNMLAKDIDSEIINNFINLTDDKIILIRVGFHSEDCGKIVRCHSVSYNLASLEKIDFNRCWDYAGYDRIRLFKASNYKEQWIKGKDLNYVESVNAAINAMENNIIEVTKFVNDPGIFEARKKFNELQEERDKAYREYLRISDEVSNMYKKQQEQFKKRKTILNDFSM